MSWVVYALAAAFMLASHQLSFKFASHVFHPVWGAILMAPLMALLLAPFAFHLAGQGVKPAFNAYSLAVLLGMAVTGTGFLVLYLQTFHVAPSTPMVLLIVDVGAVVISIVAAALLFNEGMSLMRAGGIVLAIAGMALALKG